MDFGRTAGDYVTYRAGFPHQLFEGLVKHGIGKPGQAILDLGTGTGSLARGFARQGATVMGLDISAEMLAAAKRVSLEEGLDVAYRQAPAEETGLPSGSFDVVSAGQCWHWFDRPVVTREAQRLLKPEGRLIVAHLDWLPLPGNVVEATEELIRTFNPSWSMGGGAGIYPAWFADVAAFREIESFTFDLAIDTTTRRGEAASEPAPEWEVRRNLKRLQDLMGRWQRSCGIDTQKTFWRFPIAPLP